MNVPLLDLIGRAEASAAAGRRDEAAQLWRRVLAEQPRESRALNGLGNWHLARGEADEARALLLAAAEEAPDQPAVHFNLAAACRGAGDVPAAIRALDRALALDPYFVQATFQKAVLLEEIGRSREAAILYRSFLETAPPEVRASPRFTPLLERARSAVARDNAALGRLMAARSAAPSIRMREAMAALLGEGRIYVSEPTFLAIPRLPAVPFFEGALMPWLAEAEACAAEVLAEARAVIGDEAQAGRFVPYVDNPPGVPANQWAGLDRSKLWSAFFFWKHGRLNEENAARCPGTAALLQRMPLLRLEGRAPNAFFSLLAPGTRIPPHNGVTNARATVHLPLIVPAGCGFRVGAETRTWKSGRAWAFDDTIEHEAWNDSNEPRLILIFDVWNPYLDEAERGFVTEMLAAHDAHHGRRGLADTI